MMLPPLYPGGKAKVVTFSYDDGVRFDGKLIEIFNRHGMKGTFNLNAGLSANSAEIVYNPSAVSLRQTRILK